MLVQICMNFFHVLNTKEYILKMLVSKQLVSFDFHGVLNVFSIFFFIICIYCSYGS